MAFIRLSCPQTHFFFIHSWRKRDKVSAVRPVTLWYHVLFFTSIQKRLISETQRLFTSFCLYLPQIPPGCIRYVTCIGCSITGSNPKIPHMCPLVSLQSWVKMLPAFWSRTNLSACSFTFPTWHELNMTDASKIHRYVLRGFSRSLCTCWGVATQRLEEQTKPFCIIVHVFGVNKCLNQSNISTCSQARLPCSHGGKCVRYPSLWCELKMFKQC